MGKKRKREAKGKRAKLQSDGIAQVWDSSLDFGQGRKQRGWWKYVDKKRKREANPF